MGTGKRGNLRIANPEWLPEKAQATVFSGMTPATSEPRGERLAQAFA